MDYSLHMKRACRGFLLLYSMTIMTVGKMQFPKHYDLVRFTNFLVQAAAPAMLVRQTDILLHVFVNT